MRVYIVREGVFTLSNGVPASNLINYENFSKRYLAAFSDVVLVGRLFHQEDPSATPAVGPRVQFLALPGYQGPMGFLRNLPGILRTIFSSIDRDAAYILRIPGAIPSLYSILLWLRGIPFSVEVAADPFDGYSRSALKNHPLAPFFRWLFVSLTRWQCRSAKAAAYVTREALQKRYPARSRDQEYSFTSLDLVPECYSASFRSSASFDTNLPRLVLIGNMQQTLKGHDTLIRAMKKLKDDGLRTKLTIIGYGSNRQLFENLASNLGLKDDIVFAGKLPNGKPIRDVLDRCDLFVLPSRQEGLPRALLEAMARALPAIATRVGGTPELLEEDCLISVDDIDSLAKRIKSIATDATVMQALSERNLRVAKAYNFDEVSKARAAFYNHVIFGKRALS